MENRLGAFAGEMFLVVIKFVSALVVVVVVVDVFDVHIVVVVAVGVFVAASIPFFLSTELDAGGVTWARA